LGDDIPIVVVLKAMGLECDEEIVQLVGTEPEIVDLFSGSLEEPYYLGIYSQDQVGALVMCVCALMCTDDDDDDTDTAALQS
jgi:DNA-directed RNA polymerase beta subunit